MNRTTDSCKQEQPVHLLSRKLKAIHGPSFNASCLYCSSDGCALLTDPSLIIKRWAELFELFNLSIHRSRHSDWGCAMYNLSLPIHLNEVLKAIDELKTGKAPEADSFPPEIFKYVSFSSTHMWMKSFIIILNHLAVGISFWGLPRHCSELRKLLHWVWFLKKVKNIRSLHKGMKICVLDMGYKSDPFKSGIKQGCVITVL